jgi:peptidoglycan/LPS O-acetylase OafA/YrhL
MGTTPQTILSDKHFHIPSLDGIRGLAALTVFVSHAGLKHLIPGGWGVTVFFFLSGYLITTLLRREHEQIGEISFRRFYLRRIYRIIPPMYLVLALVCAISLAGILSHGMEWPAVAAQFAHFTNYYMIVWGQKDFARGTSVMWSLAVEEHFYLLFPLALVFLLRRFDYARIAAILLFVCVIALLWRCYIFFELGLGHSYTYLATDTRLDSLLYGCIMGMWLNPVLDQERLQLRKRTAICLFGVGTLLLLATFAYRNDAFRETLRYSLQGVALFPIFYCAVRYPHWGIFSWLQSRVMRALGLVSYTFYLSHVAILELMKVYGPASSLLRGVLAFIATLAFSAAMYFLVEKRFANLRKRLHGPDPKPVRTNSAPAGEIAASSQ